MLSSAAKLNKDHCSDALGNPIRILDIWVKIIVESEELELVRFGQLLKTTCLLILSRIEREGGAGESLTKTPFLSYKKGKYAIFLFAAKKLMVHIVVS